MRKEYMKMFDKYHGYESKTQKSRRLYREFRASKNKR